MLARIRHSKYCKLWVSDGVLRMALSVKRQVHKQIDRLGRKISFEIAHFSLRLFKHWYHEEAVPLAQIQLLHGIGYGHSQPGFSLAAMLPKTSQKTLVHRALAQYSPDNSDWALPVETINFLQREVERNRPDIIIEFGSGFSSICFCRFMLDLYGAQNRIYVCSIEQDLEYAKKTEEHAQSMEMGEYITVLHAPLSVQKVEGMEVETYTIPENTFRDIVAGHDRALIVVDGPFGDGLVRFPTLPMLNCLFPGKHVFYLDDALRSKELSVVSHWSQLDYIYVRGVHLLGRGLAAGEMRKYAILQNAK